MHYYFGFLSEVYTIEFQKRGLPHAHIILFMNPDSKVRTAEDVDRIISAELLDPAIDPILYQLVGGSMLHGPCRYKDNDGPCIKEGKCSKFFPKKYREKTVLDENGFPQYRRRNDSRIFFKKGKNFEKSLFFFINIFINLFPFNFLL